MTVLAEEAPANYVPAAAVIRRGERYPESLGVKRAQAGFQAAASKRGLNPRKRPNWKPRMRQGEAEFPV